MREIKDILSINEKLDKNLIDFNQAIISSQKQQDAVKELYKEKLEKEIERIKKFISSEEEKELLIKERDSLYETLKERELLLESLIEQIKLNQKNPDNLLHLYLIFMSLKHKILDCVKNDHMVDITNSIRNKTALIWQECEKITVEHMLTWCEKYGADFIKEQKRFYRPDLFK